MHDMIDRKDCEIVYGLYLHSTFVVTLTTQTALYTTVTFTFSNTFTQRFSTHFSAIYIQKHSYTVDASETIWGSVSRPSTLQHAGIKPPTFGLVGDRSTTQATATEELSG